MKTRKKGSAAGSDRGFAHHRRIALNPEGYAKIIEEARKAEVEKFPFNLVQSS